LILIFFFVRHHLQQDIRAATLDVFRRIQRLKRFKYSPLISSVIQFGAEFLQTEHYVAAYFDLLWSDKSPASAG
jgi:hypothetical protein